jgi:DNA-binding CsgD family transcriptional regulator
MERVFSLSSREYEVLMWAARGKTYADIGMILGIGYGTVKTNLDTARLKLRATNVTHAVALAFATGLIGAQEFRQRTTLSDRGRPSRNEREEGATI